ncbi:unnamed protein product [Durusdinium trenchii]|uniref:Ribosomal protein S19 n=1 Tax=Durusdinium trenchii TaxID=1381693 RepID=A0ABP0PY61_9DINO
MSIDAYDKYFKEGRKIVTVKDVEPEKFISAFSQHLKRQGRFELPKWADVVKTSKARELPPSVPWMHWGRGKSATECGVTLLLCFFLLFSGATRRPT